MSNFNLPAISIKPVQRISPSRYYAFQLCSLKEILAAGGHPILLPVQPAARIGSVVHKLIEMANVGKIRNEIQFNEAWQAEISNNEKSMISNPLEGHLVPLEETADDYDVKRFMALQMIRAYFSDGRKQAVQHGRSRQEEWLETKDKKIGGKLDQIQETLEGAVIVDYKTGNILDEKTGKPKEEYQQQLKLYAALYFENYKTWPKKLVLTGIDQSMHEVLFSQDDCINLLEQAKKLLGDTNDLILSGLPPDGFASPSPEACRYCLFRPGCQKYWKARQDSGEWPLDLIGEIKEKGFSGNKLGRLVIEREHKQYFVRSLSSRHGFLYDSNKNVLICNLKNDTSPNHYIERSMTAGYGF